MNGKNWCALFLLNLCCFFVHAQQKNNTVVEDPKKIKLFFEKTYLQTDRTYYTSGEDIWFSAYLLNGKNTSLTNTSNNLYVELISPRAALLERKLIRLADGLGNGDFKLKDTLQSGWYNLRAYTNWMHNFGDEFVFNQKIYVTNLIVAKDGKPLRINQKNQEVLTSSTPKKTIAFFPEGGSLVDGLASIVAFKTGDDLGNGLKSKGSVISSKGDTITTFQSSETGMGLFAFTPLANETYKVEGFYGAEQFTSALPKALKNGLAFHITIDSTTIKAAISCNENTFNELQGKPLSIVIKHAGDNVYTGSIVLTKPNATVTVPTKDLPAGISVITLIDHLGRPNCERLVFVQSANKVNFLLSTDKTSYAARDKVTLNIKATNAQGQPVKTNLSLAAVDGLLPSENSNIVSYLLLQSELKGEIKNADQYFDPLNPARFKQLDLLLLTQGWREYLWRKLADSTIKISYMPEPGITISGLVRGKLGSKPMPDMNITLFGPDLKGAKIYFTKTDAAGKYYLDGLKWYGNQSIKLSSQDNKGKKGGWLQIDTSFKSIPFLMKKTIPFLIPTTLNEEIVKRVNYNKKFKVGDSIMLDEVKITGVKKEKIRLFDEDLSTFGYPDQVFNITAADYSYKGLEHFLLTNIKEARPVAIDDTVSNEGILLGKTGRPRIIVNDQEDLQDRLDYYSLTMDQVSKIVVKHLINNSADDVFLIYLYLKDSALNGNNLHLLNVNLNGYYNARTFFVPTYTPSSATFRDLRSTVFWAPLLKTDEKGELSISFFNSDNKGNVIIKADGITAQGTAVTYKTTYKTQ